MGKRTWKNSLMAVLPRTSVSIPAHPRQKCLQLNMVVEHSTHLFHQTADGCTSQKHWSEDTVRTCVVVLHWNVIKWKFSDLRVGNGGRGPYMYPIFSPPGVLCALLLAGRHLACLISPFAPGVHSTCLPVTASQPRILSQFTVTAFIVKEES